MSVAKICSKIYILQELKNEKDSDDFWDRKLSLKVKLRHLPITAPHYTNSQNSIISFGYVDFYAKNFLILYTPFENSTNRIAIMLAFALTTQDGFKVRQEGNFPNTTVPNGSYPFWAVLHLEGWHS